MKKVKKFIILLIVILVIVGAASGGIYAYQKYQKENQQVEVLYVSDLNSGWWGDSMTSSGTVSDSYTQSIKTEDNIIKEVKVEEGAEVKIGDPLLVYDTSEVEIELEMKKLELQGIKNDITLAERELERLKKIKPTAAVTPSSPTSSSKTSSSSTKSSSSSKQKEYGTVVVQVQKKDGDAYNYIDTTAKPYTGKGTAEEPFRFLCTQECYVLGEYLNLLVKNEQIAAFEIWSGNSVTEGTLQTYWTVNGMEHAKVAKDSKWLVSTQEEMEGEIVLKEAKKEEKSTEQKKDDTKKPSSESESEEETYTADELKKEIAEKENELKELQIDRKSVRLEMKSLRKKKKEATVLATINGVVRLVEDPVNPPIDGSNFMEISGTEGLYLKGTISELMLDQIKVGQVISASSWSNGQMYSAEITEISEYPMTNRWGYYGEGNPNVSYYSYLAYIEDPTGLSNGDDLEISITSTNTEEQTDSLYIEKAYVRDEDGKSYVLKVGEDDRLVKQYVKTGKILYGSVIEIKSGLSLEDRIAFPYGKAAKEGVKAVEREGL